MAVTYSGNAPFQLNVFSSFNSAANTQITQAYGQAYQLVASPAEYFAYTLPCDPSNISDYTIKSLKVELSTNSYDNPPPTLSAYLVPSSYLAQSPQYMTQHYLGKVDFTPSYGYTRTINLTFQNLAIQRDLYENQEFCILIASSSGSMGLDSTEFCVYTYTYTLDVSAIAVVKSANKVNVGQEIDFTLSNTLNDTFTITLTSKNQKTGATVRLRRETNIQISDGGIYSVTPGLDWFTAVEATTKTLSVSINFHDEVNEREANSSFTVEATSGVLPNVRIATLTPVTDERLPNYANSWVSGFSKVRVYLEVAYGMTGIQKISISGPPGSTTINNPSPQTIFTWTTANSITGRTTITITLTDAYNQTVTHQVTIQDDEITVLPTLTTAINSGSLQAGNSATVTTRNFVTSYDICFYYNGASFASLSIPNDPSDTGLDEQEYLFATFASWFSAAGITGTSFSIEIEVTDYLGRKAKTRFTLSLPSFRVEVDTSQSESNINNTALVGETVGITVTGLGDRTGTVTLKTKKDNEEITLQTLSVTSSGTTVLCPKTWFSNNNLWKTSMVINVTATSDSQTATTSFTVRFPDLSVALSNNGQVEAGGTLIFTISNRLSESLTAEFKANNRTLVTQTFTHNEESKTIPASYFDTANVTTSQTMAVNVTITDRFGRKVTTSFQLSASDAMKPTLRTPVATIVQPSPASQTFPSTYIAGVSKVKISVEVVLPTSATVKSCVMHYDISNVNMQYNSATGKFEGTTSQPISDDTSFEITVTDMRGMNSSATVNVTGVMPYTRPLITNVSYHRCFVNQDQSITVDDLGDHCSLTATFTFMDINGSNVASVNVTCGSYTDTRSVSLVSTQTFLFAADIEHSFAIEVTAQDSVSTETMTIRLSTAGVIMDFLRGGKGIGLGKVAEYEEMVDVNPDWTLKAGKIASTNLRIRVNGVMTDVGTLIGQILSGLVTPLVATESGTYTPPAGYVGYNPVTVNTAAHSPRCDQVVTFDWATEQENMAWMDDI